jgi:hypothetical protein
MHQTLRLRRPRIKHRSSIPQYLQNVGILFGDTSNPSYETSVVIKTFHTDMLLHADGDAV